MSPEVGRSGWPPLFASTARDANPVLSPNNLATDATVVNRIDLAVAASETIPSRAGGIGETSVSLGNVGTAATTSPSVVTIPLATDTAYRPTGSTTAGWTCTSPGVATQITCTRSQSIPAAGSAPALKVRTNVGPSAPASWNTAVTASTIGEPSTRLANNTASVSHNLEIVDLTLTKSHDPPKLVAGKRASFKIKFENIGNSASTGNVRVDDSVNASFQNVSASGPGWTCPAGGNAVTCTRTASVPAGQTTPAITVSFDIPSTESGTRNSVATVTNSGDPFAGNDTAGDPITIIAAADLAVSIDQPQSVRVGDDIDITYMVRNLGSESTSGAPSVKLKIGLSAGLEPIGSTSSDGWDCSNVPATQSTSAYVACELDDPIEPGGSSALTAEFSVGDSGSSQVATLATGTTAGDTNSSNNYASAFSDLTGFDLETSVTVPSGGDQDLKAGVTSTRAVTVKNVGTSATTGPISVKVPLPDGVQWDSSVVPGVGWSCSLQVRMLVCNRTGA